MGVFSAKSLWKSLWYVVVYAWSGRVKNALKRPFHAYTTTCQRLFHKLYALKNHPYGTYKNFQTERFFKLHFQPNPNQTPERTKAHRIGPMYWEYFYFRDLSYMCHMIWNIFSKKLTKNIGNVTWKRDNMTFNLEIQLSTSNTII